MARGSSARAPQRSKKRSPVSDRVARLISQFYGSQRAAARAWGTTRATLDRIVTGKVEAPRAGLLVRIARACGADMGWLLTGEGPAPQPPHEPLPSPAQEQWRELVESLGLDDATRDALLLLPGRVRRAFAQMLVWYPITERDETPFTSRQLTARRRAEDLETQAWSELLKLLLDRYGLDTARVILQRNRHLIAIGFNTATHSVLFHYLTREPGFDKQRVARAVGEVVKQSAMVFHPRDVGDISAEEREAAINPFGPPVPEPQIVVPRPPATGGGAAVIQGETDPRLTDLTARIVAVPKSEGTAKAKRARKRKSAT